MRTRQVHLLAAGLFCCLAVVPARAATWYVATSGRDTNPGTQGQPFLTLVRGITAAKTGDIVLVGDGTYSGAGNIGLDFLGRNITVKSSGGAAKCIIDCQGVGPAFTFRTGETAAAVLDGLTIQNGVVQSANAGGIQINGAGPTVRNCVIKGCAAAGDGDISGGGVYVANGQPRFERCAFSSCLAASRLGISAGGAVAVDAGGNATFTDCAFTGNGVGPDAYLGFGGGVAIMAASANATFRRCTFTGNSCAGRSSGNVGGAALSLLDGHATLIGCTILNNGLFGPAVYGNGILVTGTAPVLTLINCSIGQNVGTADGGPAIGGGVYVNGGGDLTMTNCLIHHNTVQGSQGGWGGGIAVADAATSATITHCDIVQNLAQGTGGGPGVGGALFVDGGAIVVTNTIVTHNASNDGPELAYYHAPAVQITYSSFRYVVAGIGNIVADDPHFVNPNATDAEDYHIVAGSPCIDKGTATAPAWLPYDKDDNDRVAGAAPDIGAYEAFSGPYMAITQDLYVDRAAGSDSAGDGTAAKPFQTVSRALAVADPVGGSAGIHVRAANYNETPHITGRVKIINWGNAGKARVGAL